MVWNREDGNTSVAQRLYNQTLKVVFFVFHSSLPSGLCVLTAFAQGVRLDDSAKNCWVFGLAYTPLLVTPQATIKEVPNGRNLERHVVAQIFFGIWAFFYDVHRIVKRITEFVFRHLREPNYACRGSVVFLD